MAGEFLQAAHDVQSAWADAAKLDQPMVLPWVTAPGSAMLAMYTAELTVHTWDLAVATGQIGAVEPAHAGGGTGIGLAGAALRRP